MTKDSPDGTSSLVTIAYYLQIPRMALFAVRYSLRIVASRFPLILMIIN